MNESRISGYLTEDIAACVGPNSDRYLTKFQRLSETGRSFNWMAALFTIPWFAYRKMWKETAVLLVVTNILGLLISYVQLLFLSLPIFQTYEAALRLMGGSLVVTLILFLIFGFLGDRLYCDHVTRILDQNDCENRPPVVDEELERRLRAAGGTSWLAVLAILIINSAISQVLALFAL